MPVLSRFYGIIIRMYFLPKEHNPPHVHVIYQDETFSIAINELIIIDGDEHPTPRVLSMVKEWISQHRDELLNMWETQELHSIEPLR
ncbi:MAG: DUF4160 domain-containing protein [Bacilli bacterium]|nr:DUF4160 domain-containing protein [Bacilli bacterium]